MSRATPGPWHENVDGVVVADKSGPWREIIADVYSSPLDANNRKANAKLIAAAPDLYAELTALLREYGRVTEALLDLVVATPVEEWPAALDGSSAVFEHAAQVLVKARGES